MLAAACAGVLLAVPRPVPAARFKDIAALKGVRENQVIGYGLVVGLAGSGDKREPVRSDGAMRSHCRYRLKIDLE